MADARPRPRPLTAREAGLVGCRMCSRVSGPGAARCPCCGSRLASREKASLQRVWAWLVVGMVCYVPANTYPMMTTSFLGSTTDSTILGGIVDLVHHGAWGIAAVVGIASLVIPVAKFLVIALLASTVQFGGSLSGHARVHLFEAVEFIGRWSMIDVFVVAILAAAIQLGFVATVTPGPAAVFFALAVIFTMISAQSLDPRLLWDGIDEGTAHR